MPAVFVAAFVEGGSGIEGEGTLAVTGLVGIVEGTKELEGVELAIPCIV